MNKIQPYDLLLWKYDSKINYICLKVHSINSYISIVDLYSVYDGHIFCKMTVTHTSYIHIKFIQEEQK